MENNNTVDVDSVDTVKMQPALGNTVDNLKFGVDSPDDPDGCYECGDPDAYERWAIVHEADPLPPGALDFLFGFNNPDDPDGEGLQD